MPIETLILSEPNFTTDLASDVSIKAKVIDISSFKSNLKQCLNTTVLNKKNVEIKNFKKGLHLLAKKINIETKKLTENTMLSNNKTIESTLNNWFDMTECSTS